MEVMLDAAHADGITSLCATPHVTPGVQPLNNDLLSTRLDEARAYCHSQNYQIDLYAGAEIMFTPALERFALEGQLPALADSGYVLLEFVPDISYAEMESAIGMLQRCGYDVIIAHIERYECLYRRNHAYRLKDAYDVRYQVNCSSVLKGRGLLKDHHLKKWFKNEIVDFVATDSHDAQRRPTRMRAAHEALTQKYGEAYADRLAGLSRGLL